jgi:hypothetical protein
LGDQTVQKDQSHPSLCLTLLYRSAIHQFEGEKEKTATLTIEILTLAKEYGLVAFSAYASGTKLLGN